MQQLFRSAAGSSLRGTMPSLLTQGGPNRCQWGKVALTIKNVAHYTGGITIAKSTMQCVQQDIRIVVLGGGRRVSVVLLFFGLVVVAVMVTIALVHV
eukprot:13796673-Alexandrium_andersonii.AAC.1